MLEQYDDVIFMVDMRSCGVWTFFGGTTSFTRNSRKELSLAVLQLAATTLSWRYTCSCGLLPGLRDPTYEADSRSSDNIPYLKCNFDVNFGGVISCFYVIVLACILSMNICVK